MAVMCVVFLVCHKSAAQTFGEVRMIKKKKKENFVGCVVLERKALTQKQKQSKIKKKNKKPGNV